MRSWSLNHLEVEGVKWDITGDIITNAKVPTSNRNGFSYSSSAVKVPRIFYRILGIKDDLNGYKSTLYKTDKELSKFGNLYLRIVNGMNRNISLDILSKLDNAWNRISKQGMSSNTIIEEIDKVGLIPGLNNKILELQIKNNFRGLLEYFWRNNEDIKPSEMRIMVNNIVHWLNFYMIKIIKDFDYTSINPKILYFGDITMEEVIFLNLASTIGIDVIYYNPMGENEPFEKFDPNGIFSTEILYNKKEELREFPGENTDRYKTSAYEAKEYMNENLFTDDSGFYRPWQFSEYDFENLTLKTTYEEIKIWIKENAQFRDGWRIQNKKVDIPNIFAKISGTHEDINAYWKEIDDIVNLKNTKFYKTLPLNEGVFHIEYNKFNDIYPRKAYAEFDIYKLMRAPWWKYRNLRLGLQKNIAEKIKEIILNPPIQNIDDEEFRDFQVYLFSVLINLDDTIMELLQGFDYPGEVPKIIIYNNEKNGNLTYEDSIMLVFLNRMGFDIIIFNPSGYSDVERFISKTEYDNHTLAKMRFKLDYKKAEEEKKGFFKKLFGK